MAVVLCSSCRQKSKLSERGERKRECILHLVKQIDICDKATNATKLLSKSLKAVCKFLRIWVVISWGCRVGVERKGLSVKREDVYEPYFQNK